MPILYVCFKLMQEVDMDQLLCFHALCGQNAQVSTDGQSAERLCPLEEFTGATVFSSRPLKPAEWFAIVVGDMVYTWSGSVQLGGRVSSSVI